MSWTKVACDCGFEGKTQNIDFDWQGEGYVSSRHWCPECEEKSAICADDDRYKIDYDALPSVDGMKEAA